MDVIQIRLCEVRKTLRVGAHLSVILLCGSILEALLLGAAQKSPAEFNQASGAPKNRKTDSTKPFQDWSLAQLIDVACELDLLKPDVKKFGHGLRDFRNYIHPYEQLVSGLLQTNIPLRCAFKC